MELTKLIRRISNLQDVLITDPSGGQSLSFDAGIEKWTNQSGVGGDVYREFDLSPPGTTFTVTHNLGKRPSVRVVDSAGTEIDCEVTDVLGNELNAITIRMNGATSGKAILN